MYKNTAFFNFENYILNFLLLCYKWDLVKNSEIFSILLFD